jgi:hypothetical protein
MKNMKLPLDVSFRFFNANGILVFFTIHLKREKTYLSMVNLIITNGPYEKTKVTLKVSVKFFWVEEQNHKIIVLVNSDSLTIYNENSFPIGFY